MGPQAVLRRRRADPGLCGPGSGVRARPDLADRHPFHAGARRRRRLCAVADDHGRAHQSGPRIAGRAPSGLGFRDHVAARRPGRGAGQARPRRTQGARRSAMADRAGRWRDPGLLGALSAPHHAGDGALSGAARQGAGRGGGASDGRRSRGVAAAAPGGGCPRASAVVFAKHCPADPVVRANLDGL